MDWDPQGIGYEQPARIRVNGDCAGYLQDARVAVSGDEELL